MKSVDPADDDDGGGMPPLGSLRGVQDVVARYNIAPDGRERSGDIGVQTLYGPGMIVEMPSASDDVRQLMVTMTDDDFAFPVLLRLCREQRWTMMDPETGQRLRFGG